jgi:hypothetical protein
MRALSTLVSIGEYQVLVWDVQNVLGCRKCHVQLKNQVTIRLLQHAYLRQRLCHHSLQVAYLPLLAKFANAMIRIHSVCSF